VTVSQIVGKRNGKVPNDISAMVAPGISTKLSELNRIQQLIGRGRITQAIQGL
jgi:hypothetical protein